MASAQSLSHISLWSCVGARTTTLHNFEGHLSYGVLLGAVLKGHSTWYEWCPQRCAVVLTGALNSPTVKEVLRGLGQGQRELRVQGWLEGLLGEPPKATSSGKLGDTDADLFRKLV